MAAPSLPGLPAEILLEIQSSLSYGSRLALRLACRDIYFKVDDPNRSMSKNVSGSSASSTRGTYNMTDLLEIELWPEYNSAQYRPDGFQQPVHQLDFFACYMCRKIRRAGNFANAMMKAKRGKLGNGTVEDKRWRFCIPCGITHGRYIRGTSLRFGGASGGYGFICLGFGQFERAGFGDENVVDQKTCARCQQVRQKRSEPRWHMPAYFR